MPSFTERKCHHQILAFSALHSEKLLSGLFLEDSFKNIPIPVFLPKAPEYYPAYIYTDDELKRLFDYCAYISQI